MKQWKGCRISCDVGSTSFSNPYIASPLSQLILQPFHRFTYVTAHSIALALLHLRHRLFTLVTAHSPTLPPLYLNHSSFSNPSTALLTSQLILQSFRCFTYVTGHSTTLPLLHLRHRHSRTSSGELPMHRGMKKNSVWWTSLLQQVTKFRSSYSFG